MASANQDTKTPGAAEAVLQRLRAGDPDEFEKLVRDHQDALYRLLFRLTGDSNEAQDLLQDSFLRVCTGLSSFRGQSSLRTWLHRIAINTFLNERRRPQPEQVDLATVEEMTPGWLGRFREKVPDPEDIVDVRHRYEKLADAVARLPKEYKVVLLLRDREGYSSQEVADLLEISVSAVKSRLHRARLWVRKELLRRN